MPPLTFSDA